MSETDAISSALSPATFRSVSHRHDRRSTVPRCSPIPGCAAAESGSTLGEGAAAAIMAIASAVAVFEQLLFVMAALLLLSGSLRTRRAAIGHGAALRLITPSSP